MRNHLAILVLLLSFFSLNGLSQEFSIEVDTTRYYRLHLPADYSSDESYPLLLALHGGFGFHWQFENETDFSHWADSLGFIVAYPQAIGNTRSWNTGTCCGYAYNNDIDDLGFMSALIDTLSAVYSVDESRVYATGFSSGAMMSYAMACGISHKLAAVAPVSSSMLIADCTPGCTPVPILHLHAEPDSSALFHGGISPNPLLTFYYPPVDSVMQAWAQKNSCGSTADTMELSNGTRIYTWSDCESDSYQEIWLSEDGGHKWMGTEGEGVLSADSASQDFYATEVVWDFLSQWSKECSSTVSLPERPQIYVHVYPNPSQGEFLMTWEEAPDELSVFDASGRLIETRIPIGTQEQLIITTPGVYHVVFSSHGATGMKKLVVLE